MMTFIPPRLRKPAVYALAGVLFAAAWQGEFRFRTRQDGHWVYEAVDRQLLNHPDEIVSAAREVLAKLRAEPAAAKARAMTWPARSATCWMDSPCGTVEVQMVQSGTSFWISALVRPS